MTELWSGLGGVVVGFLLSVALTMIIRVSDSKQKLASYMVSWVGVVRAAQLSCNADRLDNLSEQVHLLGEQICVWGRGRIDAHQVMHDTIEVAQQIHYRRSDTEAEEPEMTLAASFEHLKTRALKSDSQNQVFNQKIAAMQRRIGTVLGSDWLSQAEVEL